LDDLSIIHVIRRDAILGIESALLAPVDRDMWANRRSADFYADRVTAGAVTIAISGTDAVAWGSSLDDRITGIYVRPSSSRKGIARIVMSQLELDIENRGYRHARLESSPNAVGFYAKLGYIAVGIADDDGAVPMEKSLI
jgi:ribosomal protein S18 acetylase RimI-like enzyme